MAKVTAPLLSMGAQGQIGQSVVFDKWRGIPVARRYTVPANPNTSAQQTTRNAFAAASFLWKISGSLLRAPWDAQAQRQKYLGRNKFISDYVSNLRGDADMADYNASPGAKSGLAGTNPTGATGTLTKEIDVTLDVPAAPTGWTLASVDYQLLEDIDPAIARSDTPVEVTDATAAAGATWSKTITAPLATTDYVVSMWPVWTRPDGETAYGASRTVQATSQT